MAAILGTGQSLLESVMLKRRIMGPGWLALAKPVRVNAGRQVSPRGLHGSIARP